jgi:hypothetical protein
MTIHSHETPTASSDIKKTTTTFTMETTTYPAGYDPTQHAHPLPVIPSAPTTLPTNPSATPDPHHLD